MLFRNLAVQIPIVVFSISDQYFRSSSKAELVARLNEISTELLKLNEKPSLFKGTPLGFVRAEISALTCQPITSSLIVGELAIPGTRESSSFQCVTLDGKISSIRTAVHSSSVLVVSPICTLLHLLLIEKMFASVAASDLTQAQRFERDKAQVEINSRKQAIMDLDLSLWRAPEEVIASFGSAIFIRRLYNIVSDGALVDIISPTELPQEIHSYAVSPAISRAKMDVQLLNPGFDTTQVEAYLDDAGVAEWFTPSSLKWIRISSSLLINRRLRPIDLQVIEAEPERMFFLLGELSRWAASADIIATAQYASFIADVLKVFAKLRVYEAMQFDTQYLSLAHLIESTYGSTGDDALAIEAGVRHSAGQIGLSYTIPDALTTADTTELLTLFSLKETPLHLWPPEYRVKLNLVDWHFTLASLRVVNVSFDGPAVYKAAFTRYAADSSLWQDVTDTWSSLLTVADIITTIIAAQEVQYGQDAEGRYAQIRASLSKFYSRLLPFVLPASTAAVLPIRRFV